MEKLRQGPVLHLGVKGLMMMMMMMMMMMTVKGASTAIKDNTVLILNH